MLSLLARIGPSLAPVSWLDWNAALVSTAKSDRLFPPALTVAFPSADIVTDFVAVRARVATRPEGTAVSGLAVLVGQAPTRLRPNTLPGRASNPVVPAVARRLVIVDLTNFVRHDAGCRGAWVRAVVVDACMGLVAVTV